MKISLKRRVAAAMVGLSSLTVVIFALLVGYASDRLEHTLLNAMVREETAYLLSRLEEDPLAELPQLFGTAAFFEREGHGHLPENFRDLPLGINHAVQWQGATYHVNRAVVNDGVLTVAINIEEIESRERWLTWLLLVGGLVTVSTAGVAASLISGRVAKPVVELAQAVSAREIGTPSAPLAPRFQGQDVEQIALAVDHYAQRIQEHITRERSFSAAASHELRTPLTVIRSSLEIILAGDLVPAARRSAERALKNCESLTEVIAGLLVLARNDNADQPARDVVPWSLDVLRDMEASFPNHDFRWTLPEQCCLPIAAPHWKTLIANLVRNAAEHGHDSVDFQLSQQQLCISDNGPGIAPEVLDEVFKFSGRGMDSLGAGLGLYIVAEICAGQGWTIQAEPLQPNGLMMRVEFSGQAADKAAC